MPPSWIMKLTEGWGEAKNNSKGEGDGFKLEEGEGEGRKNCPFSTYFQNGGLSDPTLNKRSFRKKRLLYRLGIHVDSSLIWKPHVDYMI